MLDKDQDNIIWGPIAGILNELLSNGHYRLAMINVWLPIPDSVVQSQIMKNMAPRFIYQLEELIKRDPFCLLNYSLYPGLNELTGNKHSLIDILLHSAPEPKEGLSFNILLPAIRYINKEALKRNEFDFIVTTSTTLWTFWLNYWRDGYRTRDDENFGLLGPLIESLLVKNMVAEADRLFAEFMETIPSQEIQKQLVQIANKRGKTELAKKWAAMRPNQSPNIGVL